MQNIIVKFNTNYCGKLKKKHKKKQQTNKKLAEFGCQILGILVSCNKLKKKNLYIFIGV